MGLMMTSSNPLQISGNLDELKLKVIYKKLATSEKCLFNIHLVVILAGSFIHWSKIGSNLLGLCSSFGQEAVGLPIK